MKILIVEDNAAMADNIAKSVATPEDEVFRCTTSALVLHMYEEHKPNVVLMDIRIKPLNGVKTTKMLKDLHPEVKVVMLTTHNEPEYREGARQAGAVGYILKDNLSSLRNFVEVMLGVKKE
ncbi:MAG TPA: response regulator transcription factor [Bacteroidota bacterium]|nr:response regulator transcription factor [Bacteroidota bacterium]